MKQSTTNKRKSVEPEFVGVDQAETMSGISRWTWRRFCYAGRIASTKVGKRLLIPITEIRRVMAEGYRPAIGGER